MSGRVLRLWAAKDEFMRPNSLAAYIFAAICVALATLIRLAVYSYVTLLFPTYYVAVLIVSLVGGFGVSLFAIFLSVLSAWWFFMPPTLEFGTLSPTHAVNIVFFVGMSLAMAAMGNLNRVLLADLKKQRDHSQLLFSELQHRNKNMLMVVQAVITQTVANATQRGALLSRIGSLVIVDELRSSPDQQFVDLQQFVKKQLASFPDRISMQGPPLPLDSSFTKVVVLILNELVTNAVKYGALSSSGGNVVLTWWVEDNVAHITWREVGGPPVAPRNPQGKGLALVERLAKTVGGEFSGEFNEEGIVHNITLPLPKSDRRQAQEDQALNATRQSKPI
jgi:two-component sensor histidine kinase